MSIPVKGDGFINIFDENLRVSVVECVFKSVWNDYEVTFFALDSKDPLKIPLKVFNNMYEKITK